MDTKSDPKRVRYVYVCLNEDCCKRGNEKVHADLQAHYSNEADVEVREYICFGNCDEGANTVVFPDRVWFSGLRQGGASVVLDYLRKGILSEAHSGKVDEELAETIWDMLALEVETDDSLVK